LLGRIHKSISGWLWVEVSGAGIEKFLNTCNRCGIELWNIRYIEPGKIQCEMSIAGLKYLRKQKARTGCKIKILKRDGVRFDLKRIRSRMGIWIGVSFICAVAYTLSAFIWTVDITGCERVSEARIMQVMNELGVKTGVKTSSISPEYLRNHALLEIPELSWLTITTRGSHAVIDVRERDEKPEIVPENVPCDIVAAETGLVTMLRVKQGQAVVEKGKMVEAGDMLVTGFMSYLDGQYVRLVHADADVYARVWDKIDAVMVRDTDEKRYTGEESAKYAINIAGFRINFYFDSSISYAKCDKIVERNRLSLGDGIYLPVTLIKERYVEYETVSRTLEEEQCSELLRTAAANILSENSGGNVNGDISVNIRSDGDSIHARAACESVRQIGVEQNQGSGRE